MVKVALSVYAVGQVGNIVAASRRRRRAASSCCPSMWRGVQPHWEDVRLLVVKVIVFSQCWWKPGDSAAPRGFHEWHWADQILDWQDLKQWELKLLPGSARRSPAPPLLRLQANRITFSFFFEYIVISLRNSFNTNLSLAGHHDQKDRDCNQIYLPKCSPDIFCH